MAKKLASKSTRVAKTDSAKPVKATRNDGWANTLTGLGAVAKDKRQASQVSWTPILEVDVEELYAADDMAARIVDKPVDEAMKNDFDFTGVDKEDSEDIKKEMARLGLLTKFSQAWKTGRLFGGAGLLLLTDEMEDLAEPLADDAEIIGATVLNRFELWVQFEDLNKNLADPAFGTPRFYQLQPRLSTLSTDQGTPQTGERIHCSRIMRFDGAWLPNALLQKNSYWYDSVLNRTASVIRDYSVSFEGMALTLSDFSVAVFKLRNLADLLAADGGEMSVLKRMEIVNLGKSIARCMVLDAEGESVDHLTRNVTGLKELLEKMEDRLVAASEMPRTVLLGQSPNGGGLNQTGNPEQSNWYDFVKSQQEINAKPQLIQLGKMVASNLDIACDDLDLKFRPLYVMDDSAQATLRYTQAQTDQIYYNMGAVDSDEIAQSRFGGDAYSTDTELDQSLRKPGGRLDPDAEPIPPVVAPPAPGTPAAPGAPKPAVPNTQPPARTK